MSSVSLQEWRVFAEINWLEKVGEGSSRVCYALDGKRVLKLSKFDWTGQANSEVQFWEMYKDTPIADHIAHLLDYGDGWCVMERAEAIAYYMEEFSTEWETKLIKDLVQKTDRLISDVYALNIGKFGDVFKIVDYGLV